MRWKLKHYSERELSTVHYQLPTNFGPFSIPLSVILPIMVNTLLLIAV